MKAIRKPFISALQILMHYENGAGRCVCVCVGGQRKFLLQCHCHGHCCTEATGLQRGVLLCQGGLSLPPLPLWDLHACLQGCRRVGFKPPPTPQLPPPPLLTPPYASPIDLPPTQEPEQEVGCTWSLGEREEEEEEGKPTQSTRLTGGAVGVRAEAKGRKGGGGAVEFWQNAAEYATCRYCIELQRDGRGGQHGCLSADSCTFLFSHAQQWSHSAIVWWNYLFTAINDRHTTALYRKSQ